MYCPRCSQEQSAEQMRFCSRCGFPLGVVSLLVANDGVLKGIDAEGKPQISRRAKGIRLGAIMMIVSALLMPSALLITMMKSDLVIVFSPVLMLFFAGLSYLIYTAVKHNKEASAAPSQLNAAREMALPAHQTVPVPNWRQPVTTSEIVAPDSVTDQTTRLLKEE